MENFLLKSTFHYERYGCALRLENITLRVQSEAETHASISLYKFNKL